MPAGAGHGVQDGDQGEVRGGGDGDVPTHLGGVVRHCTPGGVRDSRGLPHSHHQGGLSGSGGDCVQTDTRGNLQASHKNSQGARHQRGLC